MHTRKLDYVVECMGGTSWWCGVYPYRQQRRYPTLYLIGDGALIRRVWFVGFDESESSVALRVEITDWLMDSTKDMPI